jgi:hypothetical protein
MFSCIQSHRNQYIYTCYHYFRCCLKKYVDILHPTNFEILFEILEILKNFEILEILKNFEIFKILKC